MTSTEELPLLGSERPGIGRMNPLAQRLQRRAPICRVRTQAGDEAWLVTRHAELKALLMDKRIGSTHPDPPNRPRYLDNPLLDLLTTSLSPEEAREGHLHMRNLLTPHFSARRMAELQPLVAERVTTLLDEVVAAGPPADLHAMLALPLSFHVLCDLLAITERDTYMALLGDAGTVHHDDDDDDATDRPSGTSHPLFGFLARLAAEKRGHPDEGLLSHLVQTGVPDDDVAAMAAMVSISYQVTPTNISAGIALFAINADQRDLLVADPELQKQATEEVLRMSKVSESFVPRYANADIDIAGVTIRAGDLVLCDHYSAGFDDRVFDAPQTFDITRRPNPHLAFSRGISHCIGAPLARLEMSEVFSGLLHRLPGLRLAQSQDDLPIMDSQLGGGIARLPVLW